MRIAIDTATPMASSDSELGIISRVGGANRRPIVDVTASWRRCGAVARRHGGRSE